MAEQGSLILTAPQITEGSVVVTPGAPPSAGKAEVRRVVQALGANRVRETPRPVTVNGATLVIDIAKCLVGDQLCWTSYP